ncbi:MAG: LytR C-terminal domain-containing protein [Actinomycetota bacterium]
MPGKHAPESPASFILSLSRAVGGALAAVAVMTILVVALLNRGSAEPQGGPAIETPTSSPTQSTSPSPSPTATASPTREPFAPSKVTVQVLNGTSRAGLAAATAKDVEKAGYKLAGTGNAATTAKSTIFYRKGRRAEALAFQASFPDFTVLKEAPSSQAAILRVVLGADWPEQA